MRAVSIPPSMSYEYSSMSVLLLNFTVLTASLWTSQHCQEVGVLINPMLQMRKWKLEEAKNSKQANQL